MSDELIEFNPFVVDSPEYHLFEQAKAKQGVIEVLMNNATDEVGQAIVASEQAELDRLLEEVERG